MNDLDDMEAMRSLTPAGRDALLKRVAARFSDTILDRALKQAIRDKDKVLEDIFTTEAKARGIHNPENNNG